MRTHRNPQASLSKPPIPDNRGSRPRTSADFDNHVNELRKALGRVDALADQRHLDEADPDVVDRRTSYLIDLAAEAAMRAFDELNRAGDAFGSEVADERS